MKLKVLATVGYIASTTPAKIPRYLLCISI